MFKRLSAIGLFAIMSAIGLARESHASPIVSFDFSLNTGWNLPDTLTGSFSGMVRSTGFILLSDLTSFVVTDTFNGSALTLHTSDLTAFTYNPSRGDFSLAFLAQSSSTPAFAICVGVDAALSPICNPGSNLPDGTTAVLQVLGTVLDYATEVFPTVTRATGDTESVPEPSSWTAMILGLVCVGFVEYRRTVKSARQSA